MTDEISLATLITPSKTVEFEFPGLEGFAVDLCFLAREEMIKLRKRSTNQKFNRRTHQPEETLDEDRFLTEYVRAVVKGWKGLKLSYLEELLLVDTKDLDPNADLPYNQANAELLMKNSVIFDTWVTESVGELENFTKDKLGK